MASRRELRQLLRGVTALLILTVAALLAFAYNGGQEPRQAFISEEGCTIKLYPEDRTYERAYAEFQTCLLVHDCKYGRWASAFPTVDQCISKRTEECSNTDAPWCF